MEREFFTNLPPDMTINILSRLSIRGIAISKCVCKPWLNLIESNDIVKSKIKTASALVHFTPSARCTIFEIDDEDESDLESHDLHYHPLTDLVIPHPRRESMEGITANALLLLYSKSTKYVPHVYICNPMTREYTDLCFPLYISKRVFKFGFGVSKISGKYKVVCIYTDNGFNSHYVYTLGTDKWKRVEAGAASGFIFWGQSFLCNHNLHWKVIDFWDNYSICGFDVETECCSIISFPSNGYGLGNLCVMRDCLCYYYRLGNDFVIWLMKEYQVEESWTLEYKLNIDSDFDRFCMLVDPIKLFKDGDILMLMNKTRLIYYSNKTRTFEHVGMFKDLEAKNYINGEIRCSSFSGRKPSEIGNLRLL
ncbi:putative F-box protein At1g47730 [Salvia hispanica]|uniref:putative F-box protein At1g47730 n=1 Tax=Salvia hispanica TaxID=49212 RepID=UPI002009BE19|nr:putative F-box protein At1g47730 [Salvia hispanica]